MLNANMPTSCRVQTLDAFTVTFYTSDVRAAGTAADAMLTMHGADGQTGRQHLIVNQGGSIRRFNRRGLHSPMLDRCALLLSGLHSVFQDSWLGGLLVGQF